jgi:hypothetical protein
MGLDITGIGAIFDFGSKVIDKIFPNKDEADKAKVAMMQMQQQGELQSLQNEFQLAIKQGEINVEEAKSTSLFVSGWRPFVGWVCGIALAYNYVLMPLLVYIIQLFNAKAGGMPALAMGELMTLLIGMLGLGVLRSVDKNNGVANK